MPFPTTFYFCPFATAYASLATASDPLTGRHAQEGVELAKAVHEARKAKHAATQLVR